MAAGLSGLLSCKTIPPFFLIVLWTCPRTRTEAHIYTHRNAVRSYDKGVQLLLLLLPLAVGGCVLADRREGKKAIGLMFACVDFLTKQIFGVTYNAECY